MTSPSRPKAAGVVPAAGDSRRMGTPKGLLELEGRSFVARVVRALTDGGCAPVLVVVEAGDDELAAAARAAGAEVLENPIPGEGPITSLRLALERLPADVEGVVYLPVDHALVDARHVAELLAAASEDDAPLALPVHGTKRGHPAFFRRELFDELLDPELEGGARTVVHRHLERARLLDTDDPAVVMDIDTPEAYEEARRMSRPGAAEVAEILLTTAEAGGSAAAVTVVDAGERELLGLRMVRTVLDGERRTLGSLGRADVDEQAEAVMEEAIADPRARDGLRVLGTDEGGRPVEVYLEVRRPIRELVVVGAGHVAQPMAHLGALLGYRVTVLDDRPDFATRERFPDAHRLLRADFSDPFAQVTLHERSHLLLVTRGHKYDYQCLVRALRTDPAPAYIGMIGSRRRVRATYVQLLEEGFDRSHLDRIHAPVGLDVGAETPEEIAVAVAAELVMLARGGSGAPLRSVERVAERFFNEDDET